jgi:hypothetical protein
MHSLLVPVKQLYQPQQPSIGNSGFVQYRECSPSVGNSAYIHCYWELKTAQPLATPFTYRVVADGCIDIFFSLPDTTNSYIMGFCRQYTEFPLPAEFHYIGIRFLPAMFPLVFGVNASLLSDRFEELWTVIPELSLFIREQLVNTNSLETAVALLDPWLLKRTMALQVQPDSRFFEAMQRILKEGGIVQVEKDLDTGLSARQLRRLFSFYVGDTAKVFSKVIRFQQALQAGTLVEDPRRDKFFFDAGYYDQAHFIKEFRHFYGDTPALVFGQR